MRCTLLINGLADDLPIGDAIACANMLVTLGRAVPPNKWVDSLVAAATESALEDFV